MNTKIKAEKCINEFKLITCECSALMGISVQLTHSLTQPDHFSSFILGREEKGLVNIV